MKTMIVVVMDTVLFISPEKAEKTNETTNEPITGYGNSNIPDHPAAAHPGTQHSEMGKSRYQ